MASGDLIPRVYTSFRGVDFREGEVDLVRSPDALNVWKNYKDIESIETRPEIELHQSYDNTVWGVFFYKVGNTEMQIVHSGTKLYRVEGETRTELFTGMKPARSQAFVYNQILYIKDGINYLKYDGEICSQVVGFIPTTTIGRKPSGGGTVFQDVNMLSAWRKNTFLADGESTEYHLDTGEIDGEAPVVLVNGNLMNYGTDFDYTLGTADEAATIVFKTAPPAPLTVGQDNVTITFKKTVSGHADRINKCTLLQVFDNRVFFSGNQDYPNTLWHSSLNDPTYCSDLDFYNEGLDLSPVKSMVAGNNALWVFKEPSQANTTVFYHNPVIDADYGKIYPQSHSSIATGCIGAGINFNDDIAFFSDRGMEAINGDITTEQVIAHRSTMVDAKLLKESNYKNMILEEWEGYLLVIIDNKVYLADSRALFTNADHNEYEWFYWELEKNITCTKVKDGVLYIGTEDGIYTFNNTNADEYTEVTFTEENGEYVLYGESTQNGTPTPDTPVEIVNTYKAGNYKTIINGREYRFTLDDDLRSVPSAKDKVYIKDNKLYVDRKIGRVVFDGSEHWILNSSSDESYRYWFRNTDFKNVFNNIACGDERTLDGKLISNYFTQTLFANTSIGKFSINNRPDVEWFLLNTNISTLEEFKIWLSTNNVEVQYELETPIEKEIDYMASPISYWTTPQDKFKHPQYQKTSNKRGCVVEATGDVTVYAKTDKTEWELIGTYTDVKDYFTSRIKRKKFKDIQLKFYSNTRFSLESATLECFIGGYIKR